MCLCCDAQCSAVLKVETVEWEQRSNDLRTAFGLPDEMPVMFSSITGEGKREIWKYILEVVSDSVSHSKHEHGGKNSKRIMDP